MLRGLALIVVISVSSGHARSEDTWNELSNDPQINTQAGAQESTTKYRNIGTDMLIQERGTDWIDRQYEEQREPETYLEDYDELPLDEFSEDYDELPHGQELSETKAVSHSRQEWAWSKNKLENLKNWGKKTGKKVADWGKKTGNKIAQGFGAIGKLSRGGALRATKTGGPFTTWMSSVPDDTLVSDVNMPGTHDTMAIKGTESNTCGTISGYVICQDRTFLRQLQDGIRMLDIRLRATKLELSVHHGPCYLNSNFENVLATVRKFLTENPSEFIIMRVKEDHTIETGAASFHDQMHNAKHLGKSEYKEMFTTPGCTRNDGSGCTVNMMRGKVMMLTQYPGDDGPENNGMGIRWPCTDDTCQDEYQTIGKNSRSDKYTHVLEFMKKAAEKKKASMVYINFWSAQGDKVRCALKAIKCISDYVNPRAGEGLITYFEKYGGVQCMDFYTEYNVDLVVKSNFANKPSKKGVTISAHKTKCSYTEGREAQYLERQTLSCETGVLNSYRMTPRDGFYSCGKADQRYVYLCAHRPSDSCYSPPNTKNSTLLLDTRWGWLKGQINKVKNKGRKTWDKVMRRRRTNAVKAPGAGTGKCGETRKLSSCSNLHGRSINYLDRQNAYCSGNQAMSMFRLQRSGKHAKCNGKKGMEYRLGCRPTGNASQVTQYTNPANIANEYIDGLDNYKFHCPIDAGLSSFKQIKQSQRRRASHAYKYGCQVFD